jgi:prophage antirepressor-like protein
MNELIPFTFNNLPVRTQIDDDGNPWFNANDVCAILDLADSNQAVRQTIDRLTEIGVVSELAFTKRGFATATGSKDSWAASESGVFELVLSSRKPEAVKFRWWVTNEVLPSIRKTGVYKLETELAHLQTQLRITQDIHRSFQSSYEPSLQELKTQVAELHAQHLEDAQKLDSLSEYVQKSKFNMDPKTKLAAYFIQVLAAQFLKSTTSEFPTASHFRQWLEISGAYRIRLPQWLDDEFGKVLCLMRS